MSILPVTLWGLDPLLHVPIQLMIFQVKALVPVPDYEGMYSHLTHPVRMIEIMGVIQSVNRATKYISYTVDDGTGAIRCIMWIPDRFQMVQETGSIAWLQTFSLGEVVKVTGQPTAFRDVIQIDFQPGCIGTVQKMDLLQKSFEDPNAETLFRLRVLNQERDVYTKPLELPEFILQEVKNKNKEPVASTTLLDRLRAWVLGRKEFDILEMLNDPVNKEIAEEVADIKGQAMRPTMNCVKLLLAEGLLEYSNEATMEFRVVESRQEGVRAPYGGSELIILDDD
ncbi:CST complex subunit STN1 [Linnemannia exigua]|uniref:CST complex subunit STN1 n=1 Tax=Linnemannia exigua TaxID=604196 RepID=A0AAD4DFR8_9FUNG|nr:CST complex subunit STN1 [Linnemannia exigua]